MELTLSTTLDAEITPSVVKLTRKKYVGQYLQPMKTVYVPRPLVRIAMDRLSPLILQTVREKELVICEMNLWSVSLSHYNGCGYVCFNLLSEESLKRLHHHSLNIRNSEFEELCRAMSHVDDSNVTPPDMSDGTIGHQPSVDISPDMIHRPQAPPEVADYGVPTVPVYTWRLIDSKGVELRSAGAKVFLDRENCIADANEGYPVPNSTLDVFVKHALSCNTDTLMDSVYAHLLKLEYRMRVKQFCSGCKDDENNQEGHMFLGCLDDRENLVAAHAKPCHLRISSQRLFEAANTVKNLFSIYSVRYRDVVTCLRKADPCKVLHDDDGCTMYEFEDLNNM